MFLEQAAEDVTNACITVMEPPFRTCPELAEEAAYGALDQQGL